MAAALPDARRLLGTIVLGLIAGAIVAPAAALAADPPGGPAPQQPTCQERYPNDGPGGVDLQLGCVIAELVGAYSGADTRDPAPLSSYLRPLALVGLLGAGVGIGIILARRRLGRRLAPVLAAAWWPCPACRSVNPAVATTCYACGAPRPDDAGTMPRDDDARSILR